MNTYNQDIRKCSYAPENGGIGDYCVVEGINGWHLFHLYREYRADDADIHPQASRGINRVIGHAFSADLITWETKRPVISIDPNRPFENLMLFAPSIIQHQDTWYMFYTGVSHKSSNNDQIKSTTPIQAGHYSDGQQSICVARSKDLYNWERHLPGPVINVRDTQRFQWSFASNKDCRDPFIMRYEKGFLLYYTSFDTADPYDRDKGNPVIAAAYSEDLEHWQDMGSVLNYRVWDKTKSLWSPLESPSVFYHNEQYYLFWNLYEAGNFCVFWTKSPDPLNFDDKINLFGDHFVCIRPLSYGKTNSHFTAFTNEYYGVLRTYQLEWQDDVPSMYVGPPQYKSS